MQNNKKLAAIISSASQLPAKAPPVTSLPKRIEANLFELLAGTELVPIGAPTLMSAMQAAPTSEQLSDQEALAYSEQINNVILAGGMFLPRACSFWLWPGWVKTACAQACHSNAYLEPGDFTPWF